MLQQEDGRLFGEYVGCHNAKQNDDERMNSDQRFSTENRVRRQSHLNGDYYSQSEKIAVQQQSDVTNVFRWIFGSVHDCRQIDETVETAAQYATEQQYDFVPIRQLKQQTAQQSDACADILQTDGKVYSERKISEKSINTCQSQSASCKSYARNYGQQHIRE